MSQLARGVVAAAYALLLAELLLLPVPSEASALHQSRARSAVGLRVRRLLPFVPSAAVVLLYLAPLVWVIWPPAARVLLPWHLARSAALTWLGIATVVEGSALTLWSTLLLRGAHGRLVTHGSFAISRHPGVSGLALLYLGVAMLFPAWVLLLGLVAYVAHMYSRSAVEERSLVHRFGPRYHTYARHVGALLPVARRGERRRVSVAVLASGAGSNLGALWERTSGRDAGLRRARITCVISNNSGSGALAFAQQHDLHGYHVSARTHSDDAERTALIRQILDRHRVELVLLAGYMKLLPTDVVTAYRGRILNIHPALLPRHGGKGMYGLAPHLEVLADGDSHTGVTIHWVAERYDAGATVMQRRLAVGAAPTATELQMRVVALEHDTYWRAVNVAIDLIENGH